MPSRVPPGELEAGEYLDRLIELKVFGQKPVAQAPPYSTDDGAAERVLAYLNRPPLRWMAIREGDGWTVAWRQPSEGEDGDSTATRYIRLVSASAPTRPLAICRSALKLIAAREKG
jgi:hypothetical protein